MKLHPNILMIQAVAEGLGELKDIVAFVGGATTALYIDDPAAPVPTASDDVDFVVEIATASGYAKFEKKLRSLGFKDPVPDGESSHPICRKIFKGITVDAMPTDEKILGFSNRWYPEAMKSREAVKLPSGQEVNIFSVIYFLATKLEGIFLSGKDRGYSIKPGPRGYRFGT